jgi:hypothetical protein
MNQLYVTAILALKNIEREMILPAIGRNLGQKLIRGRCRRQGKKKL